MFLSTTNEGIILKDIMSIEKQTKTKRRKTMKNVAATINDISSAVVGVLKGLIVAFVFANILYTTGFDPIGGIVSLVDSFLGGGLLGLLALLVFASFVK